MLGVAPFDWQLNDSYFVIAHFHYVIVGGILYAIFAFLYYWYPKAFGRMLDKKLRPLAFLALYHRFSFDLRSSAFRRCPGNAPSHLHLSTGPRLGIWNLLSTIGAFVQAAGAICLVVNLLWSAAKVRLPGTIPGTPGHSNGPPPRRRRITTSKRFRRSGADVPLWDLKHPEDPDWKFE